MPPVGQILAHVADPWAIRKPLQSLFNGGQHTVGGVGFGRAV